MLAIDRSEPTFTGRFSIIKDMIEKEYGREYRVKIGGLTKEGRRTIYVIIPSGKYLGRFELLKMMADNGFREGETKFEDGNNILQYKSVSDDYHKVGIGVYKHETHECRVCQVACMWCDSCGHAHCFNGHDHHGSFDGRLLSPEDQLVENEKKALKEVAGRCFRLDGYIQESVK